MMFFFYGTLLRGEPNYVRLGMETRARFVGEDAIAGTLHDYGTHPGARLGGGGHIRGEVFELLDPGLLADLDELEEYDPENPEASFYRRLAVTTEAGRAVSTYAPVAPPDGLPLVPEGDWRAHIAAQG